MPTGTNSAEIRITDVIAHPLKQNFRAEIKLVIPERGVIQTGRVPRFDHLRAFVGVRFDRRRNRVARHQEQSVRRLSKNFLSQSCHARQATSGAAIDRRELIDVVDLQKRDADWTVCLCLRVGEVRLSHQGREHQRQERYPEKPFGIGCHHKTFQ